MVIEATNFIAVKSSKARGKRLTSWQLDNVTELEPTEMPEKQNIEQGNDTIINEPEILEPDRSDDEIRDEINGQERLF